MRVLITLSMLGYSKLFIVISWWCFLHLNHGLDARRLAPDQSGHAEGDSQSEEHQRVVLVVLVLSGFDRAILNQIHDVEDKSNHQSHNGQEKKKLLSAKAVLSHCALSLFTPDVIFSIFLDFLDLLRI
jgi:hypothetical protein